MCPQTAYPRRCDGRPGALPHAPLDAFPVSTGEFTGPAPQDDARPAALAEPLISGHKMSIKRGGRWLIRDIDIAIDRGEIVTVIGPNGSGKTTTARALLGLIPLDSGTITRGPGLRVGYVPQRLVIDRTLPLSVRRLMSLTAPQPRAAICAALEEVQIGHLIDAPVHSLSGGEFQRALLARALVRKPDLLVLDEPLQGVDFAGEIALYRLIASIRDRYGCGILMISHDLHLVMAETDRVVCLNIHVCCHGSPRQVAADPEYSRLFGPHAAQTLAIYRHHHDHVHAPDGRVVPVEEALREGAAHKDRCACSEAEEDTRDV